MRKILLITFLLTISCQEKDEKFTDKEICQYLEKMVENDQRYRFEIMDSTISSIKKDSLLKLQKKLDNQNTELLIEIINQKGWPQPDSLNCEDNYPTFLVFRHADKKYFDTIQKLINHEMEKGKMNESNYMFIENHLKGRPDFQIKEGK
ncbi:hypothetical protein G3I01_14645 [Gramella sp. MT6]|uniref:hypothetical protein n=1 Tax=Gramella sp. MT6 TaxID=2705471 RepID=UPI001C5CEFDA|nr:hypothetical protein [Gramella sp. MT6]QYA26682.1 hypothetical protein G3I01_14645 [Gramella sp. MT6]